MRIVFICDQCKKTARQVTTIYERKNNIPTGRILRLCRYCEVDFYKREIKGLGISTNDKIFLEKWNKNKH